MKVFFETGTSGPRVPSVPTTSGHADTHTITPEQLDIKMSLVEREELCQENKLQGWPANQKRKGQTLVDRSQVFSDKLDEMIQQLTAMEASMEEEDKRRKLHPLGEKRDISSAKEKEAVSPSDRRAGNNATNGSTVETAESLLDRLTAQVQRNRHLQRGAPHEAGLLTF
ncbi:hypothetical protein HOLleu_33694 [Holothuria leucospilota]|uniref:Uncharacterized protein n=1 Tax=Holothuria leucospilota TaxID=206669 RepID=A0A9Q0YR52_HOLLE|nr:hypothetical protein HOLleu_33694 [Holothuria leucospilota]